MTAISAWVFASGANIAIALIVTALLVTFGTMLVRGFVGKIVEKSHQRSWHPKDIEKRQRTLVTLFANVWKTIVISIAILYITGQLFPGLDFAPFFAGAGIFGVALGFGAQSLVKDFLSGIFIISENQYRVGDIIDIEGFAGTVERIGSRSTVIRDIEGNVHYFPNGMVQHVINKTMGYSMARFIIDIHPSSDIDKVIKIINKTGEKIAAEDAWESKIIEPPTFLSVGDFTSTAVAIVVAGKTQPSDQWAVAAEMRRRLLAEFEKNNIKLGTTLPLLQQPKK
jgi:small conductance mechanosensitive channel